jgi:hypothetical protein
MGDGMTEGKFRIGPEFLLSYVEGFTRGEDDFKLFAIHNNRGEILEHYKNEWAHYETALPLRISHKTVEKFGYYNGLIAGVKKLGLIKEEGKKDKPLSARQFAAFLWYNGERTLTGINDYEEFKKLKKKFPLCPYEGKQIGEMYSLWADHSNRYGSRKTKHERAEIEKVYKALDKLPLSQREDFEADRQTFYETPAIK